MPQHPDPRSPRGPRVMLREFLEYMIGSPREVLEPAGRVIMQSMENVGGVAPEHLQPPGSDPESSLIPPGLLQGAAQGLVEHLHRTGRLTDRQVRKLTGVGGGMQTIANVLAATHPVDVAGGPLFRGGRAAGAAGRGARGTAGARQTAGPGRDPQTGDFLLERHMPQRKDVVRVDDPDLRTGAPGAETRRRAQSREGDFLPRTNWYAAGTPPEDRVAQAGAEIATARVPQQRVYDIRSDPDGILTALREEFPAGGMDFTTTMERRVREAGYSALYDPERPHMFVMLDDVRPQHWRARGEPAPSPEQITGDAVEAAGARRRPPERPGQAGAVEAVDQDMIRRLNEDGGFTINPRTGEDLGGEPLYAVARPKSEQWTFGGDPPEGVGRHFDRPPTDADVTEFRRAFASELQDPNVQMGAWRNPETGQMEINLSEVFPTEREAVLRGVERGEDAIFNLQNFEDIPITRGQREVLGSALRNERPIGAADWAEARRRDGLRSQAGREAAEAEIMSRMTPDEVAEWQGLRRDVRENALENYLLAPRPEDFASAVVRGAAGRDFYTDWAETAARMFGEGSEDYLRFGALFSSLSPQTDVANNLSNALQSWERWVSLGRPQGRSSIINLLETGTAGRAAENNAVRSLTLPPEQLARGEDVLSGPKVQEFYRNYLGMTDRVTLDTWMGKGMGTTGTRTADANARRLAMRAVVRNAAAEAERLTGVPISPMEAQEMSWATIRGIAEASGAARGAREFDMAAQLVPPGRLDPFIADPTTRVSHLIQEGPNRRIVEGLGMDVPPPRELNPLPTEGVTPEQLEPGLRDIADRLDIGTRAQRREGILARRREARREGRTPPEIPPDLDVDPIFITEDPTQMGRGEAFARRRALEAAASIPARGFGPHLMERVQEEGIQEGLFGPLRDFIRADRPERRQMTRSAFDIGVGGLFGRE